MRLGCHGNGAGGMGMRLGCHGNEPGDMGMMLVAWERG